MTDPTSKAPDRARILVLGLAREAKDCFKLSTDQVELTELPYDLAKLTDHPMSPEPHAVFCGLPPDGVSLLEVAQSLRMLYHRVPLYFMTVLRSGFDRKEFKLNGFTDAFLIPLERSLVEKAIQGVILRVESQEKRTFKTVKLVDVKPDVVLDFDTFIYLLANRKHIKYSQAGEPLEAERAERLVKHHFNTIDIDTEQAQKFYRFTADQLRKLGSSQLSETEKHEKMEGAVRDLMGSMFSDSSKDSSTVHGKVIVNDCQEIVKAYVLGSPGQNEWYARILSLTGSRGDAFMHASHVSTFAALFSMGLGIGKPEELAMAGILHDIGLVDVPAEIQLKTDEQRSPEEKKIFESHVGHSLKMIQDRKLVISETVVKAVEQHHERYDGSGYPKHLSGKRLKPESQVLALANEFENLTAETSQHKPKMTALAAIEDIKRRCMYAAQSPFDPEIVRKLAKLFPQV